MKSVTFKQANLVLGASQTEYEPLVVYVEPNREGVIAKFELDDSEVLDIVKNRFIWYHQKTFGAPFHPMYLSTSASMFEGVEEEVTQLRKKRVYDKATPIKLSAIQRLKLILGHTLYTSVVVETSGAMLDVEVVTKSHVI